MVNPIKNAFWFIVYQITILFLWYTYYTDYSGDYLSLSIGKKGLNKEQIQDKYYVTTHNFGIDYFFVIKFILTHPIPDSIYSKIHKMVKKITLSFFVIFTS